MANLKDLIVNGVTRFLGKVYMNEAAADKLTLGTGPTNNMDAATKQYVDSHADNFDLSDRIAKGTDSGSEVAGAVVIGQVQGQFASKATGTWSLAEGSETTASAETAHAEGTGTTASGYASHAEGITTTASGYASHAEGYTAFASGSYSHVEGSNTTASGMYSHAEGGSTLASGYHSHAEGSSTIANSASQHVFGAYNIADSNTAVALRGTYVEIVGNGTGVNNKSNARTLDWNGNEVLAGKLTVGTAPTNNMDVATKQYVDGFNLTGNIKPGTGSGSIRIGKITGSDQVTASGLYSVAIGNADTLASGKMSLAVGDDVVTSGDQSFAIGEYAGARGDNSQAMGWGTSASYRSQHVFGEFNIAESTQGVSNYKSQRGTYIEIVGNGQEDAESNARTLDWNGNEKLAGSLTLGMGTANETTITGSNSTILKVTKSSVSSLPTTISNSKITANHQVINWILSSPDAQGDSWTATTSAGSISITGTINGTTDITLYLIAPVT